MENRIKSEEIWGTYAKRETERPNYSEKNERRCWEKAIRRNWKSEIWRIKWEEGKETVMVKVFRKTKDAKRDWSTIRVKD